MQSHKQRCRDARLLPTAAGKAALFPSGRFSCFLLTGRGFPINLCNQHPTELKYVPTSLSWLENEPSFCPPLDPLLLVAVV